MTAPPPIEIVDPDGRTELMVAKNAAIAKREAERRGSKWAMGVSLIDVQRGHPFPGAPVIVALESPADTALAHAILSTWKCQTSFERLDERHRPNG